MCFWKNVSLVFFLTLFGHDIRVNRKNIFSHFFPDNFFPNNFCSHYSLVSGKIVSHVFFPAFSGHDIRVNIKNVFSDIFPTIFFQTFFARTIRVFLEKLFRACLPPFYGHDICVNTKKRFSALLPKDCFPNILCSHYSCVSRKIVSRFFSPPFFGHDILVNIKKRFALVSTIFFPFFLALLVCSWKNCFASSFPHFLVTIFVWL